MAAATTFAALWLIAAFSLSYSGTLDSVSPAVLLAGGFVIPTAGYLAVYSGSRRFRAFVLSRSLRALTLAESSRIGGFVFLLACRLRILPGRYAVPTALSDLAIGASALAAAFLLLRNNRPNRGILVWHCLGVLGILISVALGISTSPTPLGWLAASPTSQAMSWFPWNLVPVFLGPLTLLVHEMALSIIFATKE